MYALYTLREKKNHSVERYRLQSGSLHEPARAAEHEVQDHVSGVLAGRWPL